MPRSKDGRIELVVTVGGSAHASVTAIQSALHGLSGIDVTDAKSSTRRRGPVVDLLVLASGTGAAFEAIRILRAIAQRHDSKLSITDGRTNATLGGDEDDDAVREWLSEISWDFSDSAE